MRAWGGKPNPSSPFFLYAHPGPDTPPHAYDSLYIGSRASSPPLPGGVGVGEGRRACVDPLLGPSELLAHLPGLNISHPYSRRVFGAAFTALLPTAPPTTPPYRLLHASTEVCEALGLDIRDEGAVNALGGGEVFRHPVSHMVYGGHQHGAWKGQLGDGRVWNVGALRGMELQLKGIGPTPFRYGRRATCAAR